jgi:hypothetical protein
MIIDILKMYLPLDPVYGRLDASVLYCHLEYTTMMNMLRRDGHQVIAKSPLLWKTEFGSSLFNCWRREMVNTVVLSTGSSKSCHFLCWSQSPTRFSGITMIQSRTPLNFKERKTVHQSRHKTSEPFSIRQGWPNVIAVGRLFNMWYWPVLWRVQLNKLL